MKKKQTNIIRSGFKWLPGALAITATATTQAATVQISFNGKFVDQTTTTNFSMDVGGDGIVDLIGYGGKRGTSGFARVNNINGLKLGAAMFQSVKGIATALAGVSQGSCYSFFTCSARESGNFQTFVGGAGLRNGWLEFDVVGSSVGKVARVEVTRFVFSDSGDAVNNYPSSSIVYPEYSAIPEPSSFALLTLGAAGLLARRRRKLAA